MKEQPEPEGRDYIINVGYLAQLNDVPRKKKKNPIGFSAPKPLRKK